MGAQHKLRRYGQLIAAAVAAVHGNAEARELVKQHQESMRQSGEEDWSHLADALDRVLDGERDPAMVEEQSYLPSIILETILQGIADPETLKPLLEGQTTPS